MEDCGPTEHWTVDGTYSLSVIVLPRFLEDVFHPQDDCFALRADVRHLAASLDVSVLSVLSPFCEDATPPGSLVHAVKPLARDTCHGDTPEVPP